MAILNDSEASRLLKAMRESVDRMLENQMQMKLDTARELKAISEKLDPPRLATHVPAGLNMRSGGMTVVDSKDFSLVGLPVSQSFMTDVKEKLDKIISWLPKIGG